MALSRSPKRSDFWTEYAQTFEFANTWITVVSYLFEFYLSNILNENENAEDVFGLDWNTALLFILANTVGLLGAYGASVCHKKVDTYHQHQDEPDVEAPAPSINSNDNPVVTHEASEATEEDAALLTSTSTNTQQDEQPSKLALLGDSIAHTIAFAGPTKFVIELAGNGTLSYTQNLIATSASLLLSGLASYAEFRTCQNVAADLSFQNKQTIADTKTPSNDSHSEEKHTHSIDKWVIINSSMEGLTNFVGIGYASGEFLDQALGFDPYMINLSKPALLTGAGVGTLALPCVAFHLRMNAEHSHEHHRTKEPMAPLTFWQRMAQPSDILSHLSDACSSPLLLVQTALRKTNLPSVVKLSLFAATAAVAAPAAYARVRTCQNNMKKYNWREENEHPHAHGQAAKK